MGLKTQDLGQRNVWSGFYFWSCHMRLVELLVHFLLIISVWVDIQQKWEFCHSGSLAPVSLESQAVKVLKYPCFFFPSCLSIAVAAHFQGFHGYITPLLWKKRDICNVMSQNHMASHRGFGSGRTEFHRSCAPPAPLPPPAYFLSLFPSGIARSFDTWAHNFLDTPYKIINYDHY